MQKVIFLLLSCFAFYSCETTSQQATSEKSDTLHLNFFCDPMTLDPRKQCDPVSSNLIFMMYEGLTKLEPDGSISLSLADSVEISQNRLKYIFHLKDAKWSDGQDITAHDFVYSWKKILDPNFPTPNAGFLYPLKHAKAAKKGIVPLNRVGAYATDDKTLIVKLENPTPHFLEMLAFCTYFPIPKHIEEANPSWSMGQMKNIVCSGPFVLDHWKAKQAIYLKKNPLYWNQEFVELKSIEISILPDNMTSFKLFESRQVDWLGSFYAPIPLDVLNIAKNDSTLSDSIIRRNQAGVTCQFYNTKCFPFNNLNIRKAFSMSINRRAIVTHITEQNETPAFRLIPPALAYTSNENLIDEGSVELAYEYFLKGLQELCIEEDDFPKLTLSYFANEIDQRIAQVIQQSLYEVLGVAIDLERLELKVFLDKLLKRNFHFSLNSILAQYYDPMNFLERFVSATDPKNYSSWENANYVQLIELSNTVKSKKERQKILEDAERILIEDIPFSPIYFHSKVYLKNPSLHGIDINPIGVAFFHKSYFLDELSN